MLFTLYLKAHLFQRVRDTPPSLGLANEVTDAITIVVSEETGAISITLNGNLHRNLSLEEFETLLRKMWFGSVQESNASSKLTWRKRMDKMMDSPWVLRIIALFLAFCFFSVRTELSPLNKATSNEQTDVIRDVPVDVYYDNENLIVTGLPETVDVTIEGPMALVLKAKGAKDFLYLRI